MTHDAETVEKVKLLRIEHELSCFELGEHPLEYDTPYSAGADALERLSAITSQDVSDELMKLAKENHMLSLTVDILNSERNHGPLTHFCGVPIDEAIMAVLNAKDAKAAPIQGETE